MLNTLNVNLKTDIKTDRPTSLPIKLMSQDKNNNQFILRFTNGGESVALDDSYTVEVLTKFTKSGTSRLTTAKVRQDYATWEFDTDYIAQDETVYNYVYVRKSGSLVVSADANCFVFSVDLSEIDKGAGKVAETYDENYQKHLDEFKDNVDFEEIAQAEQARKEAEILRQESYDAKVDTAIVEADVVEKVDNKVTELTPQINDLTAQLAQTTTELETVSSRVSGIDRGYGGTYATLTDLENAYPNGGNKRYVVSENGHWYYWDSSNWVSGGVFQASGIANDSVTFDKIAIKNKSSNLYNEDESTFKYYVNTYNQGGLVESKNAIASGFIPIEPNEDYFILRVNHVSYFDENKNFLNGTNSAPGDNAVISTPNGSAYMRFSWLTPTGDPHLKQQVNKGNEKLSYEPFYQYLQPQYVKKEKVNLKDATFSKPKKNLFNKENTIENMVLTSTGELTFNEVYVTSDFIDLTGKNQFSFSNVSSVAWYDVNLDLISHGSVSFSMTRPESARYMRVSVRDINTNAAQVEVGNNPTEYEPFKLIIDENYLPEITGNDSEPPSTPVIISDDYEARKAIVERNALEFIPNTKEPLNIPSYVPEEVSGSHHITHPSILYFENGWNGYKYWMAMTPYPYSDNQYENPSIVASNDNVTWVEPAPNPIAPLEETETFQSDPEILMRGNTMEMWYRATLNTSGELDTTFYRKTSTDGVNWTNREAMFTNNNKTAGEIVSPAIIFDDGIYKMWFTRRSPTNKYTMEYGESSEGKVWDMRVLDIELNFKDYFFWHGDVYKHPDGKIDMVIGCKSNTQQWAMFYTYSYDNVNFVPAMLLLKPTSATARWDNYNLYKPSLTMVGDEYYLYYSTPRHIGLTKGKTMFELGMHNKPELEEFYPVKHLRSAMNAYDPTDTFDVFPSDSIVYTKIWSSEDAGFPSLSGLLITQNVWGEYNDTRQFFYPQGQDYYLIRTATSSGWTTWKTIQETV